MRRHHRAARDVLRDGGAVVPPYHVQAQVDAGGDARGGEHVAVVGVQDVRVEPHVRVEPAEPIALQPVGRGGAAVEQPRRREHERARADRHEPGPRPDPGNRGGELGFEPRIPGGRVRAVRPGGVRRRYHHGVRRLQHLGPVLHLDQHVGVRPHQARAPGRAGHDLVQGPVLGVARDAEDPVRDAELERDEAGPDQDGHAVPGRGVLGHVPIIWPEPSVVCPSGHCFPGSRPSMLIP